MARVLGVDYGRRRLGFALSDETGTLAMPREVVSVNTLAEAVASTLAQLRTTGAARVVVGLPLNMNGTRGPMAQEVEEFVARVARDAGVPVVTWDERLTSAQVERTLLDADLSRARRKEVRDKLAAQVMLQGFLDAQDRESEDR